MEHNELNERVNEREAEHGKEGLRIVRVFHPEPPAGLWHGVYGSAEYADGEPGYQLNNGEVITL